MYIFSIFHLSYPCRNLWLGVRLSQHGVQNFYMPGRAQRSIFFHSCEKYLQLDFPVLDIGSIYLLIFVSKNRKLHHYRLCFFYLQTPNHSKLSLHCHVMPFMFRIISEYSFSLMIQQRNKQKSNKKQQIIRCA